MEDELKQLIEKGYIDEKGKPLKCLHCESSNLKNTKQIYEDSAGLVEYTVVCVDCNGLNGYWSYGSWVV